MQERYQCGASPGVEHTCHLTPRKSTATPPLAFSEGTFGLVYAFSVFTHLPAELQRQWPEEPLRVLRRGGYLLLSFHGTAYAARLTHDERAEFEAGRLVVRRPEDAWHSGSRRDV